MNLRSIQTMSGRTENLCDIQLGDMATALSKKSTLRKQMSQVVSNVCGGIDRRTQGIDDSGRTHCAEHLGRLTLATVFVA